MPLWPTLCGVNLWLVALAVPLWLAGRGLAAVLATAPLSLLCLFFGLRYRRAGLAQVALLVGMPLLTLLPLCDGALADPRLQPRSAMALVLLLLIGYLVAVCRTLAVESPNGLLPLRGPTTKTPLHDWQQSPLPAQNRTPSARLARRFVVHRLLLAYTIAAPALLIYAIDLHPAHVQALRTAFGSLRRVSAMQAMLTALMTLLCSVIFYFCIRAPLASYLEHHRELRSDLQSLRRQSRRGRPRAFLYLYMIGALVGMALLILWSLRQ